uniref:Uncharacterized protein n=1 Tax=Rhizophora mucronata TaxID=61149 RepID=A0A2P2NBB2_RHIMU
MEPRDPINLMSSKIYSAHYMVIL